MNRSIMVALIAAAFAAVPACVGAESPTDQEAAKGAPDGSTADDSQEIGGFSPSLFQFKTTVEDDGADVGGGYQVAAATLSFADGRQDPTARWTCSYQFGMPLRSAKFGRIGWPQAAVITARVATEASSSVMHSRSVWLPAAFCIAFKNEMNAMFLRQPYTGLGAGVFST